MKKSYALYGVLCALGMVCPGDVFAAAVNKAATQSVVQKGTNVRAKVAATGIFDQACYDAYYGCMDQFCMTDNIDGGSCACSDKSIEYEKRLAQVQERLVEAERISVEEVEKVKAGANADIIFTGTRKYDENGNIISLDNLETLTANAKNKADRLAIFDVSLDDEDLFGYSDTETVADLVGDALRASADEICMGVMPESCASDMNLLRQMYVRQIVSDCKAFENMIAAKSAEADKAMAKAESDVQAALKESFSNANKLNRSECIIEFKKCMRTDEVCGDNWENCVSTIAYENMQNNAAQSVAGTRVKTTDVYDITASTMEVLDAKRAVCERVLDNCVAVRDAVWPAFLREIAPTIRNAEIAMESKVRQSCLTDISDCIHTACKDDIAGKGVDTMDACLSHPDMARSFCKIEIDRCERMEPLIWGYVVDKLAAMRVDACTQEVKDCFTADTRCGANFQNCIGMDYEFVRNICPLDSLVVCKANNPQFSMDDLDSMLAGLYLNIDNAALDNCQNLVDNKMIEICGSTTDCNRFAADDTLGGGSVRLQKDGDIYRVTGMISFGAIKTGMASETVTDGGKVLKPGQIGVVDYIDTIRKQNQGVPNADGIIATIEEELNNIAGTINRAIELIEKDTEIQYCVNGRNLSQITGQNKDTVARFPNLLNQVKMQIAAAALRQAQDNYNTKYNQAIADASKDASLDIKQYRCQMMPVMGGMTPDNVTVNTDLAPTYAISYEVSSGLDNALLAASGHSARYSGDTAVLDNTAGASQFGEIVNAFTGLGSNKVKVELPSGSREMWSAFNRETSVCRFCTSTITHSCKSVNTKGFLGIGAKNELNCEESPPIEKCEDIPM